MNIKDELAAYNEKAIILDGFDAAIIGIYERKVLVYSENAIIEILCKDMCMEDAIEYFSFNIESPVCDYYPIFIESHMLSEITEQDIEHLKTVSDILEPTSELATTMNKLINLLNNNYET